MNTETAKQYDTETLLQAIIVDMQHEYNRGKTQIPLAAICKRLGIRMSTLQRHFTLLDTLGFAYTLCDDAGRWTGYLTIQGLELALSEVEPTETHLSAPKLVNS